MHKQRLITVTFGLVLLLTLAASEARADAVHADKFIGELNAAVFSIAAEHPNLNLPDVSRAEESKFFFAAAHSNAGTPFGFNVPSLDCAPGIVKQGRAEVTQNPEPATMLLFGTGLVAAAAIVRRRLKA